MAGASAGALGERRRRAEVLHGAAEKTFCVDCGTRRVGLMAAHATSSSFLLFWAERTFSRLLLREAVKRATDLVRLSTCGRITANGFEPY